MIENLADFWNDRWKHRQLGWDLGKASPPLVSYIDQLAPESRDWNILIPGCGNGYEALYLLQHGFQHITMLDIAPLALEGLRERMTEDYPDWSRRLQLVCADFFDHRGQYDLILEQTFFCALEPVFRSEYVRTMHALLKSGGRLAGVLFDRPFEGGPPFGGSSAEYRALLTPYFRLKNLSPCYNSVPQRAGTEAFLIAEKDVF